MAYITIGNTVVEWDENEPLIFTMAEKTSSKDDRRQRTYKFDLSSLRAGFEDKFLKNLINVLIERRHRIDIVTVNTEYLNLLLLFKKVIDNNLFDIRRSVIDHTFLLTISTIIEELPETGLNTLKRIFNYNPHSPIFTKELRKENFPVKSNKKSHYSKQIDRILATALTRYTCVEILRQCEDAYADGAIDIGYFSFINLAFAVYVRPDSYRRIRLSDLVYDTGEDAFFLHIPSAKTKIQEPQKICYRLNRNVGMLLLKQRQQVIDKFADVVDHDDIGKLSLFPARKLKRDKSGWISEYANKCFGEVKNGSWFSGIYFERIKNLLVGEQSVNARVLRHTIGTQLAERGCSAKTIQAVLKHANDQSCLAYIDIAFHGLINELSNAMQPAFEAYMPVFKRFRSKDNFVESNQAIFSEDLETGRIELTGECGKKIRCQAAPFTCYECNQFIPCFDADHSVNIDIIQREIYDYNHAGTPFRHLVEKAKTIKYRIQLVMAACDHHQQSSAGQKDDH